MRLFVAIEPPDELRRRIGERLAAARASLPRARWVRPGNLHLTLAFLGERPADELDAIAAALTEAHAARRRFELELAAAGSFPPGRPARVTWLGVKGPPELAALHGAVANSLEALGQRPERRRFHPHLTLARCPRPWPPAAVEALRRALQPLVGAAFEVARGVLMSSRLEPSGARYDLVRPLPLEAAR